MNVQLGIIHVLRMQTVQMLLVVIYALAKMGLMELEMLALVSLFSFLIRLMSK